MKAKNIRIKRFLITLFLLLIIGISLTLSCFFSAVKLYAIYILKPDVAKYVYFLKFTNSNGQEIYLLGTLHKKHWTLKNYSLWHIEAVIEHLHPELLLIESRPEDLKIGNWTQGPLEMLFANLTARSMGIKVDGIDWWLMEPSRFGTTWKERDDRMFQNILEAIPGNRKVLIIAGITHVNNFISRFKKANYSSASFPLQEKERLLDVSESDFLFPPGMMSHIQWGIDHTEDSKYANILKEYLEIVKKVGERKE